MTEGIAPGSAQAMVATCINPWFSQASTCSQRVSCAFSRQLGFPAHPGVYHPEKSSAACQLQGQGGGWANAFFDVTAGLPCHSL
ncbi:hypothetical protein HBI56_167490 [Parastagonospora nodorum]|uniref:Uncharacterized protein n=2 Tax=Phaeosphaeria nodorum (strain SN15 / ATCC MYA-4574 / FGSC 10173) TaxID=321614 RepID=A0A7U2FFW2_PHANO|nr:hypothetical protein SNOG_05105 [Parastagonospora nodorum SN15]KAH3917054.1 hypothetical protein HBH56_051700 [Parastagonospora nodorum]EAT87496.1 hypothetical protein SNOG_05105 [Parastagonospora nodorum SN15]KAH3935576.1 hypothetical protein HBH54_037490 [Parastagonospora nodorum]KAH3942688.1 hypothetical protein HBH53_182910 [Parastagonospora nodorum]KAH3964059.1 hypothetical protein HBH51_162950 [Parastagonospora nodorum]